MDISEQIRCDPSFPVRKNGFPKKQAPAYDEFMNNVDALIVSWQDPDVELLFKNPRAEQSLIDCFHTIFVESKQKSHRIKLVTSFLSLMKQVTERHLPDGLKINYEQKGEYGHRAIIRFNLDNEKYLAELDGKRLNEETPIFITQIWASNGKTEKDKMLGRLLIGCDFNVNHTPHLDIADDSTQDNKWIHHYPLNPIWNNGKTTAAFIDRLFIKFIEPASIRH